MNATEFNNFFFRLFDKATLDQFENSYGFTVKVSDSFGKIGYATNMTPDVIDEGIKNGVDMILTHHELWEDMYGMKEFCMKKLRENGISHFFVHPGLDNADFGTGVSLLQKLGLNAVEKFYRCPGKDYHWGRIGEFAEPVAFGKLVKRVEDVLEEPVKSWENNGKLVKRVAVVSGQGYATEGVRGALEKDCDVYITGEKLLYTVMYARFAGIGLIVGSHTFTEIFGVESLVAKLLERFTDIETVRLCEEHLE
jgi:dinuclear metal center YbgI/SA1388 family protein